MAPESSTIDRLFARLEAAATGRGGDREFVRRYVSGMGRIVVGQGVSALADRIGARAFTTDEGTIAMPELRTNDPENLSLLFHEYFHQAEGHAHGGEVEERKAQAQEALVYHLAHDEGITDVSSIMQRLEHERDAWMATASSQPGGTVSGVRAARRGQSARSTGAAGAKKSHQGQKGRELSGEEAVELLFEAGFDVRGIVDALVAYWERESLQERRDRDFRFAGRTVL